MATWRSFGTQSGKMGTGSTKRNPSYQSGRDRSILELGSSGYGTLPQRGTNWWPYSNGSTCLEGSLPRDCRGDISRGKTDNRGSSRFRQLNRRSPTRFVFEDREWSLHASHLLLTTLVEQYRKVCGMNPVEERMSGGRSAAGYVQYRFLHHEGSKPKNALALSRFTVSP